MKKSQSISLVIICVVLALVGGFVGSGIQSGFGGKTSTASATSQSWVAKVKARGELRVGVAVSPPQILQNGSKWSGPALIPMENLAKALKVKFVPVGTTWANIVSGLQAGQYDAAASLDLTVERALSIQYSTPLMSEPGVFVVKRDSDYDSTESILAASLPVAAPSGSTQALAIAQIGGKVLGLDSYSSALTAVSTGRAVATFDSLGDAVQEVKADPSFAIVVPSSTILQSVSGYGVPANIDAPSLSLIDIAVQSAVSDGSFAAAMAKGGYVTADKLGSLAK